MKNISEFILAINNLKVKNYFFSNENSLVLKETEKNLNLKFPKAIGDFYSIYNGCFIPDTSISEKKINDGRFYEEIEWESNSFLKLEDIIYYYNLKDDYSIDFEKEEIVTSKRLIPFFRTKDQEFLVFTENSIILWAKEIENCKIDWIEISNDFESFLYKYIISQGEIIL